MARMPLWVKQLRQPTGWVGRRLVGPFLDLYHARLQALYQETIAAEPASQILEIGFGTGKTLTALARAAREGFVAGIDFSPDMVREARRANQRFIDQGRMELHQASIDAIPFPDRRFDIVASANTIYYWPRPQANLIEMARVLRPGGRLVLAFRGPRLYRPRLVPDGFTWYRPSQVEAMLRQAGFRQIARRRTLEPGLPAWCVSAEAPD